MKKRYLLIIIIILIFVTSYSYSEGKFGIGIILGEPTGLSAKYNMGSMAIDAAIAWSIENAFHIHADYLFQFGLIDALKLYVGPGVKLLIVNGTWHNSTYNGIGLGIRIPVGVEYVFKAVPIGVFLELVPGVLLLPATGFDFDGAIGARFYF